jgi:hypothetical protein
MSELDPPPLRDEGGSDDGVFGLATPGIDSFHRALLAAVHAGVPLDLGRVATPKSRHGAIPSGRLTLSKLQALEAEAHRQSLGRATQSHQQPSPTEILASSFGELADALPQKYVDGFAVYMATGRTDLVLDAMSIGRRAERELTRIARPSLLYLTILVLTGALGSGVLAIVLLVVSELRMDLLLLPQSTAVSSDTKPLSESQAFMLPLFALTLLLVVSVCLLAPVSAWIAKCLGGFGYLSSQRRAVAARVEHALVLAGVKGADAEQTATRLVGLRRTDKRPPRTVSRNDQSPSDLQRLRLEAKHHHVWSNTRLRQMRFGLPLLLVMTIGSAGVLAYSLTLFVPLTKLLDELSAPSVDPVMKWGPQ